MNLFKRRLPLYESGDILMWWSHGPLEGDPGQPWHTDEYFKSQKSTLRGFQFLRLHKNQWVSGSESFVTREVWRACVDESYSVPLPQKHLALWVGVDCGIKSDFASVVSVFVDHSIKKICLGPYRIWKPSKDDPLDIEATIGEYLKRLNESYWVQIIACDPWQLHQLISGLKNERYPIEEFNQTTANLTRATMNLFDLLNQKNLLLPDDPELENQSQNAVCVESSRGIRLAKEKSSKKIDAIVALATACLFAVEEMSRRQIKINDKKSALQEYYEQEEERFQKSHASGLNEDYIDEQYLTTEERQSVRFREDALGNAEDDGFDDSGWYDDDYF